MLIKLIFAIGFMIAAFTFIHKFKKAPPEQRKSWLLKATIAVVLLAIVIAAFTGRVHFAAGLVAIGATAARFGMRWGWPLMKMWFAKTGGRATFRSQYLVINVNASNGSMEGQIIKGEHADKSLGNLSEEELQTLQHFFANHDKKSYYLLTAYIRSRGFTQQGPSQEQFNQQQASPPQTQTSVNEALEIFGFKEMPTRKEIIAAHRRLISKLHPDKGGSDYLAARVNQARETLLSATSKD